MLENSSYEVILFFSIPRNGASCLNILIKLLFSSISVAEKIKFELLISKKASENKSAYFISK